MNVFYTYTLSYPSEMGGRVFYIGEGKGNRINVHEWEASRGWEGEKYDIIRSIWGSGYGVVKSIVFRSDYKQEVVRREQQLITFHGLENLANGMVMKNIDNPSDGYHTKAKLKSSSVYKRFMKKLRIADDEVRKLMLRRVGLVK